MENLNRSMARKKTEAVIKYPPTKKNPTPCGFTGEFYQIFKEHLMPVLKLFQKIEEYRTLHNSFHEAAITLIPKSEKDTSGNENYRSISFWHKSSTK